MRAGIQDYLQNVRPQMTPLRSAMLQRSLKAPAPTIKSAVPNAGLFGTSANLPTNPGPPEPPILTGGGSGPGYQPSWMGPQPMWTTPTAPSIEIRGSGPDSWPPAPLPVTPPRTDLFTNQHTGEHYSGGPLSSGVSFGPGGVLQGGNRGPQGTVYGIDPNTGQAIYNATGSPAPGFLDSTFGKILETAGATGLNMLAPGSGSIAKWITDMMRKRDAAKHTGTDLTGNAEAPAAAAAPSGPAWFQRGYQPSPGIQAAIGRGDYERAYGTSPSSAAANFIMQSQQYGGTPNDPGTTQDEGPTRFLNGVMRLNSEGGFDQVGERVGLQQSLRPSAPLLNSPSGIAAYQAAMQRLRPQNQLPFAPAMGIQPARGG